MELPPFMLYLLTGMRARSIDSFHSNIYVFTQGGEWKSHSMCPTNFWSEDWDPHSHGLTLTSSFFFFYFSLIIFIKIK